jgi:hypothetical protein
VLDPVTAEYLPAKQSSQAALPVTALYLPGTHWAQLPAGPVEPAAQDNGSQVKLNELIATFSYPELQMQLVMLEDS